MDLFVAEVDERQVSLCHEKGVPDTRVTRDYREFIEQVDAVDVVTSAELHHKLVKEALELRKDVFVEKPLTLTKAESFDLAESADRLGRILQVGHIFRFDPASQWIRDAINRGDFGRPMILKAQFCGFKRPRPDSGVSFADAIHFIDLFNFLLDHSPVRVNAVMKDFLGRDMEDEALISLDYRTSQGPVWGTVECGYHQPGKLRQVTVIGEDLSVICDFNQNQYKVQTFSNRFERSEDGFKANAGKVQQLEFPPEEPLLRELQAFIDCVQSRERPIADGWSGVMAVQVVEAALKSAASSRAVDLEPLNE